MNRALTLSFALMIMASIAGCGDDGSSGSDDGGDEGAGATGAGGNGSGASSSNSGSGANGGGQDLEWSPIITAEWSLSPGSEKTSDIHMTDITEDIYVGGIRPIAPLGTHHTVLAIGGLSAGNVIYASGVDTNALIFPEGVGLKLTAGQQLILQLHLFNASADPLTGLSGIEVVRVDPSKVQQEANLFLPGPVDFEIPPQQQYSYTGTCTVSQPQTVFAIFPHMHQLGSHFKSTLTVGGQAQVIHDDAYDFNHQAFLPFGEVALSPGDTVTTECTWNNTTMNIVDWGESSTTEMCFSILYRYPAINDGSGFSFCDD